MNVTWHNLVCKYNCTHKNNGSHDMKQADSSITIVRNVCVLTSAFMIVYLFVTRWWSAIIGTKQLKVNQSPQQWWGQSTCTRICRFLIVGNIFRLKTCMNSLLQVPPYSKFNFQGNNFFTQNWCNITLSLKKQNPVYMYFIFTCMTRFKKQFS